jgi:hypothetical protein
MVGRKRKPGERYPAGKLKRQLPDIAPAYVKRYRDNALKLTADVRFATQLGNLNFQGILTNTQTATAFRINEIYQRWHHVKHLRVTPKSPNYEQGFGSADLAEERMSVEQLEAFEARVRSATEAWESLDGFFQQLRRDLRKAIMDLCVEDQPVSPVHYTEIAGVLDGLAQRWRDHFSRQDKLLETRRLHGATANVAEVRPQTPRADDPTLRALRMVVLKLCPKLDEDAYAQVRSTFLAFRDRIRFEAAKTKRQP